MNATIDIKTPAGQSLEGFPINFQIEGNQLSNIIAVVRMGISCGWTNPLIHPDNTITITILP